jgi:cytochrome c oxidase subunit 4
MTDSQHSDPHGDAHHGPNFQLYMVVAAALAVFTLCSFLVNAGVHRGLFTHGQGFVLILGVAIVKAVLVAMFFMHLKFDWGKLYFMIIPVFVLGTMMMFVLLPDIVFAWHNEAAITKPAPEKK